MIRSIRFGRVAAASLIVCALVACGGADEAQGPQASASSSAGLPDGRIAEGETQANAKGPATGQSCIDCHGADGNVPLDASYPKLGGQYADYLAHALRQYRDGRREHALMSQQASHLTDQQIADLAAYFGSRPSQLRDLHGVH
ncbi:c-type cytochrome [Luteimonas kalidii]|uniref:C-type cytochrome n=1 Tax=Luteimonas kalidii TaxID=3042025 RepID=A0ABT6JSI0_9GAMM|nr:c-type cytochrome [Luteimonas kalidii]MDH5833648.1 c-type cytochrome [Luteimonas kalidii]